MSLAAETRAAVRDRPFLHAALRAGVVNYAGAATFLATELDGEQEAIATALRRFAESLPEYGERDRDARIEMRSGLAEIEDEDGDGDADADADAVFAVGGTALAPEGGSLTGLVATGDVDAGALAHCLRRLAVSEVEVVAAGVGGEQLVVAVDRRDGADALRAVERALAATPESVGE